MSNIDIALSILKKDVVKNVSMINLVDDKVFKELRVFDNIVLIKRDNKNKSIYLSCSDENEVKIAIENLRPDDKHFAALEEWMVPILTKGNEVVKSVGGFKRVLLDNVKLPKPKTPTRPLTVEDAEIINETWEHKYEDSIEYIRKRILANDSVGIEVDGKLVAWVLIHDDGALGCLYVLPEYRGKGYAKDVMITLSEKIRKKGKLPFAHVLDYNENSLGLTANLGFTSNGKIYWITLA